MEFALVVQGPVQVHAQEHVRELVLVVVMAVVMEDNMKKIELDSSEYSGLALIYQKIRCAKNALCPKAIPEDATPEQVKMYLQNVIDILSGYEWLEKDVWNQIENKYGKTTRKLEDEKYITIIEDSQ